MKGERGERSGVAPVGIRKKIQLAADFLGIAGIELQEAPEVDHRPEIDPGEPDADETVSCMNDFAVEGDADGGKGEVDPDGAGGPHPGGYPLGEFQERPPEGNVDKARLERFTGQIDFGGCLEGDPSENSSLVHGVRRPHWFDLVRPATS